jgi:UDP:flavonoid glycosyltransferase YjiC (YdhE family)
LILWITSDQPIWAAQIKRLKVGAGRGFSGATQRTLVEDLRRILVPSYVARAREVAAQMTAPGASVSAAADLLEESARLKRVPGASASA